MKPQLVGVSKSSHFDGIATPMIECAELAKRCQVAKPCIQNRTRARRGTRISGVRLGRHGGGADRCASLEVSCEPRTICVR